jgi:hypothetical protein
MAKGRRISFAKPATGPRFSSWGLVGKISLLSLASFMALAPSHALGARPMIVVQSAEGEAVQSPPSRGGSRLSPSLATLRLSNSSHPYVLAKRSAMAQELDRLLESMGHQSELLPEASMDLPFLDLLCTEALPFQATPIHEHGEEGGGDDKQCGYNPIPSP